MMSRTQITLDPEAHRLARERADQLGLSLAAYIRMVVQRDLEGHSRGPADVEGIIGLADSGGADIARSKDTYIDAAVARAHSERGRVA